MSNLTISGIEAGYGNVRVLHGVNLTVSDKPIALMGRNGMGKSTLAQAIMGMNPVTAGTITYGDVTLTGLSPTKIANAGKVASNLSRTFCLLMGLNAFSPSTPIAQWSVFLTREF